MSPMTSEHVGMPDSTVSGFVSISDIATQMQEDVFSSMDALHEVRHQDR